MKWEWTLGSGIDVGRLARALGETHNNMRHPALPPAPRSHPSRFDYSLLDSIAMELAMTQLLSN